MTESVKISTLFDCCPPYLEPLFCNFVYPWEILPHIKDFVEEAARLSGYTQVAENVYAGKNVTIHQSATISGPALIGEGTEIRPGAFIRGSVITGKNCVIGNSTELKNAILLDGVQIPHYNYVGDSILGNKSHMGAGSICSNLKADKKPVIIRGESVYETGLKKLGAILGDGADIGCGCVLNPGTIVGKNTSVYPLTALRGIIPPDCIVKSLSDIVKRI